MGKNHKHSINLTNHNFRYGIQKLIKCGNILALRGIFSFKEDRKRHSADLILGCASFFGIRASLRFSLL